MSLFNPDYTKNVVRIRSDTFGRTDVNASSIQNRQVAALLWFCAVFVDCDESFRSVVASSPVPFASPSPSCFSSPSSVSSPFPSPLCDPRPASPSHVSASRLPQADAEIPHLQPACLRLRPSNPLSPTLTFASAKLLLPSPLECEVPESALLIEGFGAAAAFLALPLGPESAFLSLPLAAESALLSLLSRGSRRGLGLLESKQLDATAEESFGHGMHVRSTFLQQTALQRHGFRCLRWWLSSCEQRRNQSPQSRLDSIPASLHPGPRGRDQAPSSPNSSIQAAGPGRL